MKLEVGDLVKLDTKSSRFQFHTSFKDALFLIVPHPDGDNVVYINGGVWSLSDPRGFILVSKAVK